MSSFRDQFSKEEKKSQVLDYDNSAAKFFVGAVGSIVLSIWSYYLLSNICSRTLCAKRQDPNPSESTKKKLKSQKKQEIPIFWIVLQIIIVAVCWFFMLGMLSDAMLEANLHSFDPYQILELGVDSSQSQIKKKARKLRAKYHPDLNPGDRLAEVKFVNVGRALEALIDPVGRENYRKYGNPDGPGAFQVAVGLPSFLLEKQNQVLTLSIVFFLLLIVIPGYFICKLKKSQDLDKHGVHREDMPRFAHELNENITPKRVPEVMSIAKEIELLPSSQEETAEIQKLKSEFRDEWPKKMKERYSLERLKGWLLIMAYLNDYKLESEKLKEDQEFILERGEAFLQCMLSTSLQLSFGRNQRSNNGQLLFVGYRGTKVVINFMQYFFQGVSPQESEFRQIPYFDQDFTWNFEKKFKKSIQAFINLSEEERWAMKEMKKLEDHKEEIEAYLASLPRVTFNAKIHVKDEEKIESHDLLTYEFEFERHHKFQKFQSKRFPHQKQEVWYVLLSKTEKGLVFNHFMFKNDQVPGVQQKFNLPPLGKGRHTFAVDLLCDSYIGFDQTVNIVLDVHEHGTTGRKVIEYQQEDEVVDKQTNFLGFGALNMSDQELEEESGGEEEVTVVRRNKKKKA